MPGYKFKCPYCFKEMTDTQVHFRSKRVSEDSDNPLPPQFYGDYEAFMLNYTGSNKAQIQSKYEEWAFFAKAKDEKYEQFWKNFGGVTTERKSDSVKKIDGNFEEYERKVIDPFDKANEKYLSFGDNLFKMDEHNMVRAIELKSGELCDKRVCPYCHNPLPTNYGLYDTKFISMVGVSRAGKTVFLSQLIKHIGDYGAKIGLSIMSANDTAKQFIELHPVKKQQNLPGGTPMGHFEQPLCFQLIQRVGTKLKKSMIVLYDVAGEALTNKESVGKFAPFISQSDGVIYVIDPEQFENIARIYEVEERVKPEDVLGEIHGYLRNTALENIKELRSKDPYLISEDKQRMVSDEPRQIPIAVVLSKVDERNVIDAMRAADPNCGEAVRELSGLIGENNTRISAFNAGAYNKLGQALNNFAMKNADTLRSQLYNTFTNFAFFAVSSLGCSCEAIDVGGVKVYGPIDEPSPKRIEEPFYWILYKFGMIGASGEVYSPADKFNVCPNCSSVQTEDYDADEDPAFKGMFNRFKNRVEYNEKKEHTSRCIICGYTW